MFLADPKVQNLEEGKKLIDEMINHLKKSDLKVNDKQVENILQAFNQIRWRLDGHKKVIAEFAAEKGLPGEFIHTIGVAAGGRGDAGGDWFHTLLLTESECKQLIQFRERKLLLTGSRSRQVKLIESSLDLS